MISGVVVVFFYQVIFLSLISSCFIFFGNVYLSKFEGEKNELLFVLRADDNMRLAKKGEGHNEVVGDGNEISFAYSPNNDESLATDIVATSEVEILNACDDDISSNDKLCEYLAIQDVDEKQYSLTKDYAFKSYHEADK